MTLEEIDERYHDAALDDAGEAWPEEGLRETPADDRDARAPGAPADPAEAEGGPR